jgi:DNA polymerase-3 subunit delta'
MPFGSLIGNERIKSLLARAVAEGRIGQGLIFAGPAGVGKRQFALALAQAVNCEHPVDGDACGACLPCRKIALSEHPDISTYLPDGQFIKIGQMREMSAEAQFRPYEGRRRVLIIDDADRLRTEAANSILKTLEEPPDTSLVLLITPKPYALLDTIRSRCQMLSFAPLTNIKLENYLQSNHKRPAAETELLARLACGSIGRALEIDLGVYREQRELMIELIESTLTEPDAIRVINLAEHLGKKLERDDFVRHIDSLLGLLGDIFHLKLEAPSSSLINVDIMDRLGQIADHVSVKQVTDLVERIEIVLRALPRNVSRQLAMESALLTGQ